jgi:hypothetical protein
MNLQCIGGIGMGSEAVGGLSLGGVFFFLFLFLFFIFPNFSPFFFPSASQLRASKRDLRVAIRVLLQRGSYGKQTL